VLPTQPQFPALGSIRAEGEVSLDTKPVRGGTVLRKLRQSGALKCLFPRNMGPGLEAILLNCAGGVTGGDRFTLRAHAEAGTTLTLATQAAERIYRARTGERGRIESRLDVSENARINWLPQETILFNGCSLERSLQVELHEDAALLLSESLVFGRIEMGEVLTSAFFRDRIEIRRAGIPIYLDLVHLEGDVWAQLDRPGVAGGARAVTTLVYLASDAEAQLAELRRLVPDRAGASLFRSDVLVMRLLARDSHEMRSHLVPILNHLSHDGLPRCWSI